MFWPAGTLELGRGLKRSLERARGGLEWARGGLEWARGELSLEMTRELEQALVRSLELTCGLERARGLKWAHGLERARGLGLGLEPGLGADTEAPMGSGQRLGRRQERA